MKLVVGIGNPGKEYLGTRHNVGFEVVERVASRNALSFERDKRLNAGLAKGRVGGEDVWLVEPHSYVNLSGQVVSRIARERDVAHEDVLVVLDDYHLPLGALRMREQGSAGGHNGMRSLIASFGTNEFPRLRIGIGTPPPGMATDFVLTRFRPSERDRMDEAFDRGADCVEDWVSEGTKAAMNKHNG
jgi:PTH1 family peptidyl-tRNA hydrolase